MVKVIYSPIGTSQIMRLKPKSKLTRLDYLYGCFLIWVGVTASNILIFLFVMWL